MAPVITGYYRYNDIWFQWGDALTQEEKAPMRGLFAHDSLVHEEHPFHVEGIEGCQMYLGTLSNGEKILLFSSAQINYIRYWLYTTGLTKNIIPLPYSDCLLTDADLKQVTTIRFKTGGDLKSEHKALEKVNKKIKRGTLSVSMSSKRDQFESVRAHWTSKIGSWVAVDIEAWDYMHDEMTEFGWSAIFWENGKEMNDRGHYRVKEYEYTRQTYVPNNQDKYQFGKTEFIHKQEQKKRIQSLLSRFSDKGPVFLVFHDSGSEKTGDLKFFKTWEALDSYTFPSNTAPKSGFTIIDTKSLFQALEGVDGNNGRSLGQVCNQLQIKTQYLHNAGNDAHFTLLALKEMASGDPIDQQRAKRWPTQATGLTTELKHKPAEKDNVEDDDDDDEFIGAPVPVGSFD